MSTWSQGTFRRVRLSLLVAIITMVQTAAWASPQTTRTQKMDMQGDLMIWAPSLAPNCGSNGNGADPTTGIKCVGTIGLAAGIKAGWVWTTATAFYWKAADRQTLYQAARNAGYTHFAMSVVDCPTDFYHGIYPDCGPLAARYGLATYGAVVNQILGEVLASGLIPICTGVAPGINPVTGLNKSLCPVAMDDFDGDGRAVDSATDAECRIGAVSATFPSALVYYEFPQDPNITVVAPTAGGTCSPVAVTDGDSWLQHIQQRFPNFAGVLYETSGADTYPVALATTNSYLTNLHGFWRHTQEVRFETDTYQKFWKNAGGSATQTYNQYNDALQTSATWLRGFMSGGTTHTPPKAHVPSDFDGDGKTDLGTYVPVLYGWYARYANSGFTAGGLLEYTGPPDGTPVPGDYDGDGKTDIAMYVASLHQWWVSYASTGFTSGSLMASTGPYDGIPVPGDYDGDGKTDVAMYVPSTHNWYVWYARTGFASGGLMASTGPLDGTPVPGDYDGDGKTDVAIYAPSTYSWYIWYSRTAFTSVSLVAPTGPPDGIPVPGDYDGDGKTDIAMYVSSTYGWYVLLSSTGFTSGGLMAYTGPPDGTPVPGDYDGDGKTDIAMYVASNYGWYVLYSSTGYTSGGLMAFFGAPGSVPLLHCPAY
jgi:hypothetical protein